VLRVCIIADIKFRDSHAAVEQKISEKGAVTLIHKQEGV
jgi:hypothetical protein